jgi:hypothetical protein
LTNAGGTLQPGASQVVTVSLNRATLGEGDLQSAALLAGPDGAVKKVTLRARVERAPALVSKNAPSGTLLACQWSPPNIYIEYTDESAIRIPARVDWSGPATGASELADRAGVAVYGEMGLFAPAPGSYAYMVSVSDVRGNVATIAGTFIVAAC